MLSNGWLVNISPNKCEVRRALLSYTAVKDCELMKKQQRNQIQSSLAFKSAVQLQNLLHAMLMNILFPFAGVLEGFIFVKAF